MQFIATYEQHKTRGPTTMLLSIIFDKMWGKENAVHWYLAEKL